MINQKIRIDVTDEFSEIKKSLKIYLNDDFNIFETKKFLLTHIPKEIFHKSEILLDTLLNYLMKDACEKIKTGDVKLQNAFFDTNFRERTYEWSAKLENKLYLEPSIVQYSLDPRLKQGLITSGITLIVGAGITFALSSHDFSLSSDNFRNIVSGIVTVIISGVVFKLNFNKSSTKAREIIKLDIDEYLDKSQIQVLSWLLKVEKNFNDYFYKFCLDNDFEVKVK